MPAVGRFFRDDRSGSKGEIWEPLVLATFVVAAAITETSSPVSSLFGETRDVPVPAEIAVASPGTNGPLEAGPALLDAPISKGVVLDPPTEIERPAKAPAETRSKGPAADEVRPTVPRPLSSPPLTAATDRSLISWWNDERWESRDSEAEQWRREWLRVARNNPERVPLELWARVLEWAPDDRGLLRSASRAADRYASRGRRGGWRAGPDDRDSRMGEGQSRAETRAAAAEVKAAIRDAQRRADYKAHRDDGPDSSWYRSLLRRLRGGA